jgi:hypothetical protein
VKPTGGRAGFGTPAARAGAARVPSVLKRDPIENGRENGWPHLFYFAELGSNRQL